MIENENLDDSKYCCRICKYNKNECLCSYLPFKCLATKTKVIIIKDISENKPSKFKVSSVPFLDFILENYKCLITTISKGILSDNKLELNINDPCTVILYPSDQSIPISSFLSLPSSSTSSISSSLNNVSSNKSKIKTLIVLDGSWVTVQQILHRNKFLQPNNCIHVHLTLNEISKSFYSEHSLRKEPSLNFISTSEAIAYTLLLLEDTNEVSKAILKAFEGFVLMRKTSNNNNNNNNDNNNNEIKYLSSKGKKLKPTATKSQKRIKCRKKEKNRNKK